MGGAGTPLGWADSRGRRGNRGPMRSILAAAPMPAALLASLVGRAQAGDAESGSPSISAVGDDRIAGGTGSDRLSGGRGNDRLSGNQRVDRLWGASGRDTLFGNSGRDRLQGGPGRDVERR